MNACALVEVFGIRDQSVAGLADYFRTCEEYGDAVRAAAEQFGVQYTCLPDSGLLESHNLANVLRALDSVREKGFSSEQPFLLKAVVKAGALNLEFSSAEINRGTKSWKSYTLRASEDSALLKLHERMRSFKGTGCWIGDHKQRSLRTTADLISEGMTVAPTSGMHYVVFSDIKLSPASEYVECKRVDSIGEIFSRSKFVSTKAGTACMSALVQIAKECRHAAAAQKVVDLTGSYSDATMAFVLLALASNVFGAQIREESFDAIRDSLARSKRLSALLRKLKAERRVPMAVINAGTLKQLHDRRHPKRGREERD